MAATLGALMPVARAGEISRVIELFTSQSCAKCPPADRLIAEFAHQPDTLALSFPVNYWDYTGWKDTLASPAFTQRQHAYAAVRGDGLVYTPQVVVDGLDARPGADEAAIVRATASLKGDQGVLSVPLDLHEKDGRLQVDVGAGPGAGDGAAPAGVPAGVYVLRVARTQTVEIGRGANSGHSVTYTNVVRAMTRIGDWTGAPAHFDLVELKGENEGYVVLLQTGTPDKPGAILAAAKTAGL